MSKEYKVKYHISVAGLFGFLAPSGTDIEIVSANSAAEAIERFRTKVRIKLGLDYEDVKLEILDVDEVRS